jgi:hypothetical protein
MSESIVNARPREAVRSRRSFVEGLGKAGISFVGGAAVLGAVAAPAKAAGGQPSDFPAGITFNDGSNEPSNHEMSLVTRTSTNLQFPVAVLQPPPSVTGRVQTALDIMPSGSGWNLTNPSQNGITWIDVCDANVQTQQSGTVGTARIACFTDHIELRAANYGVPAKDVWIVTGGATSPHLFLSGTTGAFATYTKVPQNSTAFTVWGAIKTWTPLVVAGSNGQSADLFGAYLTVNGVRAWSISNTGVPKWGNSNGQTTVGAAGGASSLPAAPSRFLKVIGDDGVPYVVPAYAAS